MSSLILGASHGIGFAYAAHCAKEGARLHLVARDEADLERAATSLKGQGALSVTWKAADVLSENITEPQCLNDQYDTVFIGGPSPPSGQIASLLPSTLARAFEISVIYPFRLLRWCRDRGLLPGGRAIVLGSSASVEPTCDHQFFASSLTRRTLDTLVDCLNPSFAAQGLKIYLWRPQLVWTRLSKRYAIDLREGTALTSELRSVLRDHFGITPDDPATFVARELRRIKDGEKRL